MTGRRRTTCVPVFIDGAVGLVRGSFTDAEVAEATEAAKLAARAYRAAMSDPPATVPGSATTTLGDTVTNPLNIEQPPATGGDSWKNADHEGELIVLTVKGTGEHTFESGEAEFIVADITVVEAAGKEGQPGDTFEDAWVLGRVLFGQLKRKVGRTFVGRIAKGQAQKGKSAPWQLDPVDAATTQRAVAFMNAHVVEQHTPEPAGSPAAPAPTEVGGADDDVPPWARK